MATGINVSKPIKVLDEGVQITPDVSQINFTGGVTATASGNNVTVNVPAAGITVGTTPVTSGTDGRVFFQAGGVVQQDGALFWDNTNKRLGVGSTPSTNVRLDVRAQGALSTDIAFRVRNSGDTGNLIELRGDGSNIINGGLSLGATPIATTSSPYLRIDNGGSTSFSFAYMSNNSYNLNIDRFCNVILGYSGINSNSVQSINLGLGAAPSSRNFQQTMAALTCISQGTNDSGIVISGADTAGNNAVYSNYYGRNIVLGGTTQGTGTRKIVINNGTAPSTDLTDTFALYSADIIAGNAAPHFRTENGSIIKLFRGAALTASDGTLANAVTRIAELEARLQAHGLIA